MLIGEATTSDNPVRRQYQRGLASDFQRHASHANGICQLPFDIAPAGAYFYGSGDPYQGTWSWHPFGSGAATRLPAGSEPHSAEHLQGRSIHEVNVRATNGIALVGSVKPGGTSSPSMCSITRPYGSYTGTQNSVKYQRPVQNLAAAYTPRRGQLPFELSF